MYNHKKLRGKIKEVAGTEINFAKMMGISQTSLSSKLNNKTDFSRSEIIKMQELLKITEEEFKEIFFLKT